MTEDNQEIVARVVQRAANVRVKLTPPQFDLLERPQRIKKPNPTVQKLINLGLLEEVQTPEKTVYWQRTPAGNELYKELTRVDRKMTPEEIEQVYHLFDQFRGVERRMDVDRGLVDLAISDPAHGNTVVRRIQKVITQDEANRIVKSLQTEMKERARETRTRWRYIQR